MNPIRCIALDDEPLALTILREYTEKIPYLQLLGTYTNPAEAAKAIMYERPDLLFLDIQMPDIKGIDFARSLLYKPMVVFTTAYADYAVDAFNVDAIDYLMKPIPFDRFLQAVNKALRIINPDRHEAPLPEKEFIFIKSGYKSVKINIDDISYVEGLKEYVTIHAGGHKYVKLDTLKNLEQQLSRGRFVRIHKSYIVNVQKVKSFFGNTIELDSVQLPIGRAYKDDVDRMLR
ncbi:MAG: LytTR family DNA-binding domain-containing protein [Breznakibacter sp.]